MRGGGADLTYNRILPRKTVPSHRQERHGGRTESGLEWAYQGKNNKGTRLACWRPPRSK